MTEPIQIMGEETPVNYFNVLIDYLNTSATGFIKYVLFFSGAIILLMFIIGGLQYTSGNAEGGKKTIISAFVGAAIIVFSAVIINIINKI